MTAILMALDSIKEKKGRSFLTMLGIIIGVCAVLVLVAMVTGYNSDITSYYEKLGVNKVEISIDYYLSSRSPDVTDELYEYGNVDMSDIVTGVTPDLSTTGTVIYKDDNLDTTIYLGSDQFSTCNNYTLAKGRDISQADIEGRTKVCLLGTYVAETLFGQKSPVGETVQINGASYTVVGTYYQKDGTAEDSMDDMVVIPYSLNREVLGSSVISSYIVKVDTSNDMDAAIEELTTWFADEIDEYTGEVTLENGNSDLTSSTEETASLSAILGGIAGIALLVGGIGIMNIMLVTVTERTREIGIKKAIGAPRSEIVTQFLVESAILSAMGGIIGILLGFALSLIMGKILYDLILFPSTAITIAGFLFSIAIGIGFGLYPAVKASGLQPVDALRAD
ncbi:MAG: transporter permease [Oscillospiraceae bacterium]|nr:transporter permease [Oscillospiraceae bacterium]